MRFCSAVCVSLFLASPVLAAIDGWDISAESRKILKTMKEAASSFECKTKCAHKIIGEYFIEPADGPIILVAAASDDPEFTGCHACAVMLSFFAYERRDGKWVPKWQHVAAFERGSWGEFEGEQITLKLFAPDWFGIFIETGHTGQGFSVSKLEVFYHRDSKLTRMLSVCTAADSSGVYEKNDKEYYEWQASYKMLPVENDFFDMQFILVDKVTGKQSKSRFSFDGAGYIAKHADPRLIDPYGGCSNE